MYLLYIMSIYSFGRLAWKVRRPHNCRNSWYCSTFDFLYFQSKSNDNHSCVRIHNCLFYRCVYGDDGIVLGDGAIHELWVVWLVSYCVFSGIGMSYDFIKRLKKNYLIKADKSKNVALYIGLLAGIFIVFGSVFAYITKPLTMDDVFQHKPKFSGTVIEINDDTSILIIKSSDKILVSLDVKMAYASVSGRNLNIGDEVSVYYDGRVAESYPAQINEVYAIFRNNSSEQNAE